MNDELLAHFDFDSLEPVEQTEAPPDPVDTENAPELPPAAEAPAPSEDTDAPQEMTEAQQEAQAEAERLWAGKYKTPEEMESGLRELQSHKDREIAEVKAKLEAYESLLSQPIPEQQPAPQQVTEEQLEQGIAAAPIDTFQWAMHNQPDAVPFIVGKIRESGDHVTAEKMVATYNNAMHMAQQQAMAEQYQQAMEPQIVQQNIAQVLDAVEQHYGDDFRNLRGEVAAKLQEIGKLPSYDPQTIAQAVEYSFLHAYRERAMQVAQKQAVPPASPQEFVETGTPGQDTGTSPDDALRNEILEQFNASYL